MTPLLRLSRAAHLAVAFTAFFGDVRSSAAERPVFQLTVQTQEPGAAFSDTMHGVFFEDINYAGDGGLYAELLQNRSFEHPAAMHAWAAVGDGVKTEVLHDDGVHPNNASYCRVTTAEAGAGLANTGFDGVQVAKGATYRASLHVRGAGGAKVSVTLKDRDGQTVGEASLGEAPATWGRLEATLTADRDAAACTLVVEFDRSGAYDLDVVSLFPVDTFRGRPNGLRKDLAELVAGMKPSFIRFPGGCIVEGRDLGNAYRWKDTVGPIWERRQNDNLWANRESPQYQQTYGLGFFEFFQFCEDIGAEAVPIVNCGMACQARGGAPAAMEDLGPWLQDALDLVEFANGPITSPWGKVRAEMGHPEPFGMKLLGVGNEQWQEGYFERYLVFHAALKQRHPEIQIVSSSGPHPNDENYQYAWKRFREGVPTDVVDEHYYRAPQWFLANSGRYDRYDRRGPKVFAGEFAAHDVGRASTLRAAIAEAAFMTGLWRNAEVVTMASYAPLFARQGNVQWAPDLIWFDNARSYGTPSYYVQAMYGENVPDKVLPVELDASMVPPTAFAGRVGVGTWNTQAEFKDVVVTQGDKLLFTSGASLDGWELHGGKWEVVDGALRQTSEEENVRAFVGDPGWTDYSVRLKARKLAGREGFLVSFASTNPLATSWWNLGGWANTEHGLEAPEIPQARTPGQIETGRWYDIRIDVAKDAVTCFLDGKQVQQSRLEPVPAVFSAAGLDEESGEYVVAVVNPGDTPQPGLVRIDKGPTGARRAQTLCLTSASPLDKNSLDEPRLVAPVDAEVTFNNGVLEHDFPACSLTILRAPSR